MPSAFCGSVVGVARGLGRIAPHPKRKVKQRRNGKNKNNATPLIRNKRATFDYTIEERFEAGLQLRGWEVKSVRAGRATINLSHVYVRDGELFLCNASFTPADQVCTHEKLKSPVRASF